jgi:hypothetical protein
MGLERVPSRGSGFLSPPRSKAPVGKAVPPLTVLAYVIGVSLTALVLINLSFPSLGQGRAEGGPKENPDGFTLKQVSAGLGSCLQQLIVFPAAF